MRHSLVCVTSVVVCIHLNEPYLLPLMPPFFLTFGHFTFFRFHSKNLGLILYHYKANHMLTQ